MRQTERDAQRQSGKPAAQHKHGAAGQSGPASAQLERTAFLIEASPRVTAQRQQHGSLFGSEATEDIKGAARQPVQRAESSVANNVNHTGLPDHLKSGVERLSGISLDNVKVHYNSPRPAQLQAYAYAQGSDIHLGPGQEKHLPHETWHVVQQAQGRVRPTLQMRGGIRVNGDVVLEHEADVMGAKALDNGTGSLGGERIATANTVVSEAYKEQTQLGCGDSIIQGLWVKASLYEDDPSEPPVWEETKQGYIYDPKTGEWHWGDEDEYESPDEAERVHIHYKLTLVSTMTSEEREEYLSDNPEDTELYSISADMRSGSLLATPVTEEVGDSVGINVDALMAHAPDKPGEEGSYRLYGSKGDHGWTILNLKVTDGNLTSQDGETQYRVLNRPYGKGYPFVSEVAGSEAVEPTEEFVVFLASYGFDPRGGGKIQDRIHHAVVAALTAGKASALAGFLSEKRNAVWYTSNIRQGGLNELILTSQSVDAVTRGQDSGAHDPIGMRKGVPYTFVHLQRDTSYPTKDFVFKDVYPGDDGAYQNSHVNARMYRVDDQGKKHKTVGPVSPLYHLSVSEDSLRSLFDRSHSMKALVGRLVELHEHFLARKSDILKVPYARRGDQIYEMRGGYPLRLNIGRDLNLFASIVDDHTVGVLNNLRTLYHQLEDVPDRAPPSPHPVPMSPGDAVPQSPFSPGWSSDDQ